MMSNSPAQAGPSVPVCAPTGSVPAVPLYAPADTCVRNLHRTLVFVGQSILTDGVNFAGTGSGASSFTYDFDGDCVMVDWTTGTQTSAPSVSRAVPCVFGTTGGEVHQPQPGKNFVGQVLSGTEGHKDVPAVPVLPNANGAGPYPLNWDSDTQPSCFNSSGSGTSTFQSYNALGNLESSTSVYSWENGLNNFTGKVTTAGVDYPFNAKIETAAEVAADKVKLGDRTSGFAYAIDVDRTDAGCLDKNLHAINPAYDPVSPSRIGLQAILVVGSATWNIQAPGID